MLSTDAIQKASEAVAKRIARECVAAWRAGYDFLYVMHYRDISKPFGMAFIPSNRENFPHDPMFRVEQYDLRNATRPQVESINRNL